MKGQFGSDVSRRSLSYRRVALSASLYSFVMQNVMPKLSNRPKANSDMWQIDRH